MNLIEGSGLGHTVRTLLKKDERVVLAVAFWGRGAAEQFGLSKLSNNRRKQVSIICNLRSGACNPDEIVLLHNLGIRVLQRDDLHAKVYWSASGAIVGSSNASANGLAYEGSELSGSVECNVWFKGGTTVHQQVGDWLKRIEGDARKITPNDIFAAKTAWALRRRNRHPDVGPLASRGSLMEKLKSEPEFFRDLPILVWIYEMTEMDPPARAAERREVRKSHLHDLDTYQDANAEPGSTIIDLSYEGDYRDAAGPEYGGMFRVKERPHIVKYPASGRYDAGSILLTIPIKRFEGLSMVRGDVAKLKKAVRRYLDQTNGHKELRKKSGDIEFTLFDLAPYIDG